MSISRRSLLQSAAFIAAAPVFKTITGLPVVDAANAQDAQTWVHGVSLSGGLKYPAGFKRFDYVNPDAPKGGQVRIGAIGTFDNFNPVPGAKGSLGPVDELFEALTTSAQDEISTQYGLLAESMSYPPDFSSVTYRLRTEAKWHDGKPVTPEDVIFSFDSFKKHHPRYSAYYRHVVKAEKVGDRDIKFTFDAPGNRELPQIVGQLNVLPKHWWEGKNASGATRDISATTLESPLGSGPYRIKEFVPGRTVVLERVKDYWGRDLNVNVGQNNFDEIRYEYFRDTTVALEGFKGDQLDWRTENSAKNWATAYDFPAVTEKRVVKEEFANRSSGIMQAFALNVRRDKFKDPRVRRALNFAFDFEEMNKQLFFGQYERVASYFAGTELASSGLPQGRELEILETVRDKLPPEVFTTEYKNPGGGSRENVRSNLKEAGRLLNEAGYEVRDQKKLVDVKSGAPFEMEFLAYDQTFERVFLFYKPSLERLGITVSVRTVDPTQYENRLRSWDFDAVVSSWPESLSPGNEQREYWGSQAADMAGSRNIIGIKNPAIDALIERVIFAKDRADLEAATKALDRALLWNHYVVPNWYYPRVRTARWDRFSHPADLPKYGASAFPTIWWFDTEKSEQDWQAFLNKFSRRSVLILGGSAAVAAFARPSVSMADKDPESHGMSAFGDLKYAPDFRHFDYVNVDAPKGGTFSTVPSSGGYNQSLQTFNSLNSFILKGDGAVGMDQTFASLMVRASDEPDAMYGLLAQSVQISKDKLTYRFTLRPQARFHDGTKLTAQDAAFSLNILKEKGHPIIRQRLRDMTKVEAVDEVSLVVVFAQKRGRDVPLYVAGLPIFSKAYYDKKPFDESTLDIPLGSGPYKVGRFEVGRYIEYTRINDWWAKDLPVSRGAFNFDVVRYEFYRDRDVAFEGFSGRNYLYREEFTARIWNTRYDFPAIKDGRVKQEILPDETPSAAQGWFLNTRRAQFKDPRVREALIQAFDFEWTNKTIMYSAYARTQSPFQNSDLMATGKPSPEELKLLEPFRGQVPDEVFGDPYVPPVSNGSGQDRAMLLKAQQLLQDAGYVFKDGKRRLPDGTQFRIEFLLSEPAFQAHHAPYVKNLSTLGIEANVRLVDPVQFRARVDDFDFDVAIQRFSMDSTPGDALRTYFSSQAANIKGSQNLSGIANPALDALIERIIAADSRDELRTACRAFDRVFRAGRYWVPQWYSGSHRIAYWDVFAHPPKIPRYAGNAGVPDLWWSDEAKAKKPEQAK